jgi:DNA-directed RNA polymerase subunit RPC12/RpoP
MKKAGEGRYTCPKCGRVVDLFIAPSSPPVCTRCGRRMEGPDSRVCGVFGGPKKEPRDELVQSVLF